jgi:hypothetical protein
MMGDFNFTYLWEKEKSNIDWEIYQDLWCELKDESEENYTMLKSKRYAAICFDHVLMS